MNTSDMELTFQGENANVPMCRFDVEFWDRIERQENVETMKILMLGQEVKD